MHTSLLHGWFPVSIAGCAFASLAFGVAWWRRPLWHWLVVATAAIVAAVVTARLVAIESPVLDGYPRSFLFWVALPVFALVAAVWQGSRVAWWRHVVAFGAVPLLAAFGGLQINAHYQYLPSLNDLFGAPLPGQVAASALERPLPRLAPHARASGHGVRLAQAPAARLSISGLIVPHTAYITGLVAQVDIPAPRSHFLARAGFVWVPPWYFTHPNEQLPVLMLLAGTPGTPADWLRAGGALQTAAAYASDHHGYAPMMVLPDANGSALGDTECVNGPAGRSETYLTVDVPNFMHAHFNAPDDPRQWAVGGLSEGGTCALHLVARHPDLFRTFADFAGDAIPNLGSISRTITLLYGGSYRDFSAHDPARWFPIDARKDVAGYFAVGTGDLSHVAAAEQLATAAHNNLVPIVLERIPGGGHNFPTCARALRDAFPWIAQRLDADGRATTRTA